MESWLTTFGFTEAAKLGALLQGVLHVLLIVIGAMALKFVANNGIRTFRLYMAARSHDAAHAHRLETLDQAFRYAANVAITALAGMLILTELGISIAPILAAAGVLGLAVGFGAQSLVKDYFSGLFLLLEDQIRHGDVIEAGGKSGLVEEVTLRYVRLRDYNGNVYFVPNGQISTVTNMTRGFSYAVIDVNVAYRADLDQAFGLIRQVAHDLRTDPAFKDMILDDVELAGVERWADSGLTIRSRIKVAPIQQWTVQREYLRRLKNAFSAAGIEIPTPNMMLYPAPPNASARAPAPTAKSVPNALDAQPDGARDARPDQGEPRLEPRAGT